MTTPRDEHPHELISAFMDGEISPEESRALEAHLSLCGDCRDRLSDYRRLESAIEEEEIPRAPEDLGARIRSRAAVGREDRPGGAAAGSVSAAADRRGTVTPFPPARPRRWIPLTAAASIAAVSLLSVVLLREGIPRAPAPAVPEPLVEERDAGAAPLSDAPSGEKDGTAAGAAGGEGIAGAAGRAASATRADESAARAKETVPTAAEPEAVAAGRRSDPDSAAPAAREPDRKRAGDREARPGLPGPAPSDREESEKARREAASVAMNSEPLLRQAPEPQALAKAPEAAPAFSCASVRRPLGEAALDWTSSDPAAAGRSLEALAARLGGAAEARDAERRDWTLRVPADRWEELREGLREIGVPIPPEPPPEPVEPDARDGGRGPGCAELRLSLRSA